VKKGKQTGRIKGTTGVFATSHNDMGIRETWRKGEKKQATAHEAK
jgi:hypothetical protein